MRLFFRKRLGFAVAHAGDVADEFAVLVGDANLNRGDLMVIGYEGGFGPEMVALDGTGHEHDVVGDAEGKLAVLVHQGGDGKVG